MNVFLVLLLVFGVDKDIVEVYNHEYVEVLPEYIVDYSLKCCWGISEPKRHY